MGKSEGRRLLASRDANAIAQHGITDSTPQEGIDDDDDDNEELLLVLYPLSLWHKLNWIAY